MDEILTQLVSYQEDEFSKYVYNIRNPHFYIKNKGFDHPKAKTYSGKDDGEEVLLNFWQNYINTYGLSKKAEQEKKYYGVNFNFGECLETILIAQALNIKVILDIDLDYLTDKETERLIDKIRELMHKIKQRRWLKELH